MLLLASAERLVPNQRITCAGISKTINAVREVCLANLERPKLPSHRANSHQANTDETFCNHDRTATLFATAAFAAEGGSGKIRPDSAVKVGTTELPGGGYNVTRTGSVSSTEVTLTQGKAKVTLPVQVVQARRASDAVSARSEIDSRVQTEIQFQKETLVLESAPSLVAGQ